MRPTTAPPAMMSSRKMEDVILAEVLTRGAFRLITSGFPSLWAPSRRPCAILGTDLGRCLMPVSALLIVLLRLPGDVLPRGTKPAPKRGLGEKRASNAAASSAMRRGCEQNWRASFMARERRKKDRAA